jgi:hypothetical protein
MITTFSLHCLDKIKKIPTNQNSRLIILYKVNPASPAAIGRGEEASLKGGVVGHLFVGVD